MAELDHARERDREIVWGADAIGKAINLPPRSTYYLLETGRLPARKVGKIWVGERGALRAAVLGEGR